MAQVILYPNLTQIDEPDPSNRADYLSDASDDGPGTTYSNVTFAFTGDPIPEDAGINSVVLRTDVLVSIGVLDTGHVRVDFTSGPYAEEIDIRGDDVVETDLSELLYNRTYDPEDGSYDIYTPGDINAGLTANLTLMAALEFIEGPAHTRLWEPTYLYQAHIVVDYTPVNHTPVIDAFTLESLDGATATVAVTAHDPDEGDTLASGWLDWGDGTGDELTTTQLEILNTGDTVYPYHVYAQAGLFQATLTVTDTAEGLITYSDLLDIQVGSLPPPSPPRVQPMYTPFMLG